MQIINGADDPISGRHMVQRFTEVVGDKPIISLEGVGHYPQLEAPRAVSDALIAFLKGL